MSVRIILTCVALSCFVIYSQQTAGGSTTCTRSLAAGRRDQPAQVPGGGSLVRRVAAITRIRRTVHDSAVDREVSVMKYMYTHLCQPDTCGLQCLPLCVFLSVHV